MNVFPRHSHGWSHPLSWLGLRSLSRKGGAPSCARMALGIIPGSFLEAKALQAMMEVLRRQQQQQPQQQAQQQ